MKELIASTKLLYCVEALKSAKMPSSDQTPSGTSKNITKR